MWDADRHAWWRDQRRLLGLRHGKEARLRRRHRLLRLVRDLVAHRLDPRIRTGIRLQGRHLSRLALYRRRRELVVGDDRWW